MRNEKETLKKERIDAVKKLKMRVDRLGEELKLDAPEIMINNELELIEDAYAEVAEISDDIAEVEELERRRKDFEAKDDDSDMHMPIEFIGGLALLKTLLCLTGLDK